MCLLYHLLTSSSVCCGILLCSVSKPPRSHKPLPKHSFHSPPKQKHSFSLIIQDLKLISPHPPQLSCFFSSPVPMHGQLHLLSAALAGYLLHSRSTRPFLLHSPHFLLDESFGPSYTEHLVAFLQHIKLVLIDSEPLRISVNSTSMAFISPLLLTAKPVDFKTWSLGPTASASSGNLLDILIFRFFPRPVQSPHGEGVAIYGLIGSE